MSAISCGGFLSAISCGGGEGAPTMKNSVREIRIPKITLIVMFKECFEPSDFVFIFVFVLTTSLMLI
jgi:hypothetical protein